MSQVSRRMIQKNTQDRIDSLFCQALKICNSDELTNEFIDDLFTETEKIMLAKRLSIAYLLLKGYPYHTINQTIKVSNPTIRTVDITLKYKGRGYKKILKEIAKKEEWSKFFKELGLAAIETLTSTKYVNRPKLKIPSPAF